MAVPQTCRVGDDSHSVSRRHVQPYFWWSLSTHASDGGQIYVLVEEGVDQSRRCAPPRSKDPPSDATQCAASVFTACFRWLKAFSQKYLIVGIRMLACSSQHVIFNFKLLHLNMVDPRFFVETQKETHQFWEPFFKTHTHTHAPTSFHSLQALAMSFGPAIQLVAGCDVGSGHESRGIFHVHFILWVP